MTAHSNSVGDFDFTEEDLYDNQFEVYSSENYENSNGDPFYNPSSSGAFSFGFGAVVTPCLLAFALF